jgi:hypothetical protein
MERPLGREENVDNFKPVLSFVQVHEENTKEIMSVKEFVYLIQNHADLRKLYVQFSHRQPKTACRMHQMLPNANLY